MGFVDWYRKGISKWDEEGAMNEMREKPGECSSLGQVKKCIKEERMFNQDKYC